MALAILAGQDTRITIAFDAICRDLWSLGRGTAAWLHERAMVFGLLFVNHYSEEAGKYIQAYFERMQKERTEYFRFSSHQPFLGENFSSLTPTNKSGSHMPMASCAG